MHISSIIESHWEANKAHLFCIPSESERKASGWERDDARQPKLKIAKTVDDAVEYFRSHGGNYFIGTCISYYRSEKDYDSKSRAATSMHEGTTEALQRAAQSFLERMPRDQQTHRPLWRELYRAVEKRLEHAKIQLRYKLSGVWYSVPRAVHDNRAETLHAYERVFYPHFADIVRKMLLDALWDARGAGKMKRPTDQVRGRPRAYWAFRETELRFAMPLEADGPPVSGVCTGRLCRKTISISLRTWLF